MIETISCKCYPLFKYFLAFYSSFCYILETLDEVEGEGDAIVRKGIKLAAGVCSLICMAPVTLQILCSSFDIHWIKSKKLS